MQVLLKKMNRKDSIMNKILETISGSFAPIFGVLAGSALITALLSLLKTLGWISTESGTYRHSICSGTCDILLFPSISWDHDG